MVEDSVAHPRREVCQLGEYDPLLLGGGHPGNVISPSFDACDGLIVDLDVEPVESRQRLDSAKVSGRPDVLTNFR